MVDTLRKRVLVVDDDAALLEAVRRGLEAADMRVTGCATFEDARQALREKNMLRGWSEYLFFESTPHLEWKGDLTL